MENFKNVEIGTVCMARMRLLLSIIDRADVSFLMTALKVDRQEMIDFRTLAAVQS